MKEPLKVAAGSGPRHVSFAKAGGMTFMYLISELSNTITGFEVGYAGDNLKLTELFNIPTHGAGEKVPTTAAAAEILVSVRFSLISFAPKACPFF
jgi:6-phosphogluconolactonase (cycloisomerase 2 family)